MKSSSLRLRFALWVSGFLSASLILFGVFVYFSMSRDLNAEVDNALRLSAIQSMGILNVQNGQIILADNLSENNSDMESLRAHGFTVRFLDSKAVLLGGFGLNWDTPPASIRPGTQAQFATTTEDGGELDSRIYTLPVMDNNQLVGYVQTSQSLDPVQQTLARLRLTLVLGIPFLTIFAALGGYFLAGRALRPLDEITNTARRISAEDLSARLNLPDRGDELGRLASTLDEMLARLSESFRRERQFTADASHELRTPLAAMQTIIGVTRSQKRTPVEYEAALDDLGEETNRLRSLTEDLLLLARGESSTLNRRDFVDLSALLEDVTASLGPLAETKGFTLECHLQPDLRVRGDRDGLIRLFVNLIDDAIKFTESGGVKVSARGIGKNICISIDDTGIGIPQQDLAHIFDRFYRVDASRTLAGAGLGLAIALQIARAHEGDITVSSKPGVGTTFQVTLPIL